MKEYKKVLAVDTDLQESFCRPFFDYVEKTIAMDDEAKILIAHNCTLVNFDKGHRLLDMGSVCKYIYFMLSGNCISYLTDSSGRTTTWFFHFNKPESNLKNLFAVDYKSFLSSERSTISIATLTPVSAIRFSVDELRTISEGSAKLERWLRQVNEQAYLLTCERARNLMMLSAPERYKKMLADEPHLLNMFSNHFIATYLNIAPQSLSRIRGKIVSGKL